MKFFDPNNPNEKKKMIAAGALGLIAIIVLGYVFFGGSSKPSNNAIAKGPSPTPRVGTAPPPGPPDTSDDLSIYQPINYPVPVPPVSEANRNVFAFYEAPSPTPRHGRFPRPGLRTRANPASPGPGVRHVIANRVRARESTG